MQSMTPQAPAAGERRLALPGTYNVRDVGGYPAAGERRTRWGVLYRADSLHHLAPEGQRALLARGVRTIVDLRYRSELADTPNVFAGSSQVAYRPLALYELDDPAVAAYQPQDLAQIYRMILDLAQPRLREVIGALAEPGALPAVVHCMAGKDRTGVVIALVLSALGVPRETVVDDYALGAATLEPLFDELRAGAARAGYDLDWYNRLLESNPETMRQTLDDLDRRYGGAAAYLRGIGVTAREVEHLKAQLLE
jgi:protein-tyrosine phosphatase